MDTQIKPILQSITSRNYVLAFIIVTIVILLYSRSQAAMYEDYITGLWIADGGFCEESEIESMMMFFGKPESVCRIPFFAKNSRNGYVIIKDICCQQFSLKYPLGNGMRGTYDISANISFEEDEIMPECVTIHVDKNKGMMKIYSGEMLYGVLFKNHEVSEVFADDK